MVILNPTWNLPYSFIASGSVHLGLFALLGGFSLAVQPQAQPLFIDFIETQATLTKPVELKKPKSVPLPEPAAVAASDVVTKSEEPIITNDLPSSSASAQQVASARDLYISKLTRTLNSRKRYPELARKMRQQGRLKVRFVLERDGRILNAQLVETSSFAQLNDAAKTLLSEIKQFDPFPSEVSDKEWAVTVPIEYVM